MTTISTNYLIVAGGGGSLFGGGGGGGVLTGTTTLDTTVAYPIVVGAGGLGARYIGATNGGNSTAFGFTAIGGGAGGGDAQTGANGGSGGGGGYASTNIGTVYAGGSGTAGQGNSGWGGVYYSPLYPGSMVGGGGGGAGAAATDVNGGNGVSSSISGTLTYYGGGGGGVGAGFAPGTGGLGGGGNGGNDTTGVPPTGGTPNTGGGAGGTNFAPTGTNKDGGSGIVIVSYVSATPLWTGGTIDTTTIPGTVIHTFTSSGFLGAPAGGGGGGKTTAGTNAINGFAGDGGTGLSSSFTGSAITYGSGGGGGVGIGGVAGTAGAGAGAGSNSGAGANATTAGSGGGGGGTLSNGGNGAAGEFVITYPGPRAWTGGTYTSVGGKSIHTFTQNSTFRYGLTFGVDYLLVGGGGGGGGNGGGAGGGAGGLLQGNIGLTPSTNYQVVVGSGGAGALWSPLTPGAPGSNSTFAGLIAIGGGQGAEAGGAGGNGGSGGGSGGAGPGTGTVGQGNSGGLNAAGGGSYNAGGGGGAGAVGATPVPPDGANGGDGLQSSITGTAIYYAGGGAGGIFGPSATVGVGGLGGGGTGGNGGPTGGTPGLPAIPNTGGGGGGGGGNNSVGNDAGNGGSGVAVISYPGIKTYYGGGYSYVGGNSIHTFRQSGWLSTEPGYLLNNSLRFRASNNAYLSRTPASASNRQIWTWSGWVKRGQLAIFGELFSATSGPSTTQLLFDNSNSLYFYDGPSGANLLSNALYTDINGWYHIVLSVDTTQATASDRVKMYVNNTQITSFNTPSYPAQNANLGVNNTVLHTLGVQSQANSPTAGLYFDGYVAEVNFIDGQQLTPASFGTSANGPWQPIPYTGTYGTNGFYLNFGNTSSVAALGNDTSGNGNNWTPNNISLTAGSTYDSMLDVPTQTSATVGNFPTGNPSAVGGPFSFSDGNLSFSSNSIPTYSIGLATVPISQWSAGGKWYWEVYIQSVGTGMGFALSTANLNNYLGSDASGWEYNFDGNLYNNGVLTPYGATYTTGDVIGVAFDATIGSVTFYKNGVSQGVAFTGLTSGPYYPAFSDSANGSTALGAVNFGQQPWAYAPPAGYIALNSYNV